MDVITLLTLVAFGSLFIPQKGQGGGGTPDFDSTGVQEAQPIPLNYISGFTTSVLDPETVNAYRGQVVGSNSYLTMVQTSSYEFLNIQPDEVVPQRFKDTKNPPSDYFFTVPNNNNKVYTWQVPEVYYVLKITPSNVDDFDYVQIMGRDSDANKATKILQDAMTKIVSDYNRQLADTDVIGGGDQANPQDDVDDGQGNILDGFDTMSENAESPMPTVTVAEKVDVEEDVFIVKDNGFVIGTEVNMGGSPYAGL